MIRFLTILFLSACSAFATTTFYVNTASTAGGDGSTSGTVGSTRAFATLREAVTSNNLDISDVRVIECSGTEADTSNVTQTHWNSLSTTPSTYVLIHGNNTTPGIYNTSCYRIEVDGVNAIYNNQPGHIRISNLQIKMVNGTTDLTCYRLATQNVGSGRSDNDCRIYDSIAWCPNGGNACYNSEYADGASPAFGRMRIWNFVSIGGRMGSVNAGIENYNVTVYGATDGFIDPQIIVNCISVNCSGQDYNSVGSGGGLSGYNVSEDGTHPGSNGRTGMPTFVNAGTDLHLASTDTIARNYGFTTPDALVVTDIDGATREIPWDIGADDVTGVPYAIPSTNRMTWYGRVGVPGGIPDRSTIYASLTTASTTAQIQTAIDDCPSNQVVYLAAGTYTLTSALDFKSNKGVTLRGAGTTTILTRTSGNSVITSDDIGVTGTLSITSGYTQGSSNIIVSSTTGYAVGDLIDMDQTAETGLVYPNTGRRQTFRSKVTALSSTQITFWPPLPWALKSGFSPQVYRQSQTGAVMCGIEDMKITASGTTYQVYLTATDSCWAKNVEFTGFDEAAVVILNGLNFEYRHNYAHDTTSDDQAGYGIYLWDKSSHCLVEDNIFEDVMNGVLVTKGVGHAILYNFTTNSYHPAFAFQSANFNANHGAQGMMTLWEGNVIGEAWQNDAYHGTTSHQTIFRNVVWGLHASYTGNRKLIDLNRGSYYHYVVGNIIGHSSWTNVSGFTRTMTSDPDYDDQPTIFRFGYPNVGNNDLTEATSLAGMSITYPDTNVLFTATIHGNYDTYTDMTDSSGNGIVYSGILDRTMPDSLYYPSAPSYFSGFTFPPFSAASPTAASPDDIPAGYRFLTGPGGSSTVGNSYGSVARVGTIRVP